MGKKLVQLGGGIYVDVLKGTFGYLTAMILYGLFIIGIIIGFVMGVILFVEAKDELCTKKEIRPVTRTRTVNGRTETTTTNEEVCVEEKPPGEGSRKTQAKYYGGITMMVIFGIMLLAIMMPYFIQGLGWSLGQGIGNMVTGNR